MPLKSSFYTTVKCGVWESPIPHAITSPVDVAITVNTITPNPLIILADTRSRRLAGGILAASKIIYLKAANTINRWDPLWVARSQSRTVCRCTFNDNIRRTRRWWNLSIKINNVTNWQNEH